MANIPGDSTGLHPRVQPVISDPLTCLSAVADSTADSTGAVPNACYACDPTVGPVEPGVVAVSWTTRFGGRRTELVGTLCLTDFVGARLRHADTVVAQWLHVDASATAAELVAS